MVLIEAATGGTWANMGLSTNGAGDRQLIDVEVPTSLLFKVLTTYRFMWELITSLCLSSFRKGLEKQDEVHVPDCPFFNHEPRTRERNQFVAEANQEGT